MDHAIYKKGVVHALTVSKEEFDTLLLCDGSHDLDMTPELAELITKEYVEACNEGEQVSEWSCLKEYDNFYFPKMNLMITGKCNLNCLHCFNAKDNAPLNCELSYEQIPNILDQARRVSLQS